jgi:glutathione S-transferase
VAETLPITTFIAKRSGQYEGLDDAAIARIEAICSCCFVDINVRIAELVRVELVFPGTDAARAFAALAPRVMQKLALLEAELGAAAWFGGAEPVTADFFVGEAIEVVTYALGAARRAAIDERFPRLADLAQRLRKRPALATAYETRPTRLSPRPDEDAVMERIRAVDLSALRL